MVNSEHTLCERNAVFNIAVGSWTVNLLSNPQLPQDKCLVGSHGFGIYLSMFMLRKEIKFGDLMDYLYITLHYMPTV